jgi:glycosyltransferase involved in cell wall biosynthesis
LDSSAAIITTTRTGADLLKKKYPKKSERIYTIYNGYDKKDFDNHIGGSQSKERLEKLTISHIGSLYAERTPAAFLKGLATFIQRNNTVHDVLSVRFVGQVSSFLKTFEEYEHLGVLKIEEPVEHPLAIEIMISSDLLILIMPDGSQRVVYAKVFEYLASGRPILGILPMDGEVAELLRQAGNAWLVDVKDEEGIVQSLNEIYERWRSGRILGKTDQETVRKFERRNLTSQLCEILANVAG